MARALNCLRYIASEDEPVYVEGAQFKHKSERTQMPALTRASTSVVNVPRRVGEDPICGATAVILAVAGAPRHQISPTVRFKLYVWGCRDKTHNWRAVCMTSGGEHERG